jgi:4-hydroxybenzoate polyprenyltransferase
MVRRPGCQRERGTGGELGLDMAARRSAFADCSPPVFASRLERGGSCRQDEGMTAESKPGACIAPHPAPRSRSGEPRPSPSAGVPGEEGSEGCAIARERADPSDIDRGDWVERYVPRRARPYARLARLDRPIGTWLLLFPGWWGIALAARRWPDPVLLALFALGALVMRGAGCTLNDIADRDFDGRVARTRLRPLPSGAVSVWQAAAFLLLQLAIGAAVLFSLNRLSILLGIAVLGLVGSYPYMKRVTYWPQVFLGLNFNWGALVGWTAVTATLAWPALLLYLGGVFWTVGYDTIYAHQDKEDDALIGVRSSALALGSRTRPWLFGFYAAAVLLWGAAGVAVGLGPWFWAGLAAAATRLAWQAARVDIDRPADCLAKFRSNRAVGWLMLAGIVAGHL